MSMKGYIKRVDQKVDRIRAHLIGLDIPFWQFLPGRGIGMAEKEQIRWLADRVSFTLISNEPWISSKEIDFTWRWLYGSIRYIYETCPQSDWNFYCINRLLKLDQRNRETIFRGCEEYLTPLRATELPILLNSLETAVAELAGKDLLRARIDALFRVGLGE